MSHNCPSCGNFMAKKDQTDLKFVWTCWECMHTVVEWKYNR